jgi:osmotically inducible lipoprotein OsmB
MKFAKFALIPLILAVSACGTTKSDRAASGALIGAGAGALVGSTVAAPVHGAAIGAAVGAATGAMTDPETINIGKPWWR